MTEEKMPTPQECKKLADRLARILRGKGATLQGAALLDVVAIFFAGHHPDIREDVIDFWIENMRALVPVNVALYFEPGDWDTPTGPLN